MMLASATPTDDRTVRDGRLGQATSTIRRIHVALFVQNSRALGASLRGQRRDVAASYAFGRNFDFLGVDVESNTLLASGGVAFGVTFQIGETGLVPFGIARLAYGRTSVSFDGDDEPDPSDTSALIGAGAGLVLDQRITVRPTIILPIGLNDSDASFSNGVAINFGAQGQ